MAIGLSGTALPVANGGTGSTTSTGSGSVVLQASPTVTGSLAITNSSTAAYVSPLSILAANNTTAGNVTNLYIGTANSNKNMGYMGFNWQANSSTSNFLTWGFFSADQLMNLYASGQLTLTTTINATSTTTGSITTPGGISSGQDLYIKQTGHFNYGGSSGSAQIKISPSTNGGESSISVYQNTSEGGARWSIGHNAGASGSDTFGIFSSTKASNAMSIFNTGQVSVPTAINATSTTSGAITTLGGISSGQDIYVKNTGHFNYGGSTGSAQIAISPATTNGESSITFYTDVSETGTRWSEGHNAGAVGSGNYGLWNSSKGTTMSVSASTGIHNFPFGISTTSGSTFLYAEADLSGSTSLVSASGGPTLSMDSVFLYYVRTGTMVTVSYSFTYHFTGNFNVRNIGIQSASLPTVSSTRTLNMSSLTNSNVTNQASYGQMDCLYNASIPGTGIGWWLPITASFLQTSNDSFLYTGLKIAGSFTYFV